MNVVVGHELMPDFFLDAANPDEQLKHSKDLDRKVAAAEAAASSQVDSAEVRQIMDAVKSLLNEKYVSSVGGIFVFKLKG